MHAATPGSKRYAANSSLEPSGRMHHAAKARAACWIGVVVASEEKRGHLPKKVSSILWHPRTVGDKKQKNNVG